MERSSFTSLLRDANHEVVDRRLFLLVASCACASTRPASTDANEEIAALEVEEALREAEYAVSSGDAAKVRALLATSEARIHGELASSPDRHQLLGHIRELRERLTRPKVVIAAAPPPVAQQEAVEAEAVEAEAVEAEAVEEEKPAEEEAVIEFREGPLQDRGAALRILTTAKRARSKKVSRRLYADARALFESCAREGDRLVQSTPALETASFKVGSQQRGAQWIVGQCKSKVRSLDRGVKKKKKKSSKRKRLQS